jgi:hypothetical protein
VYGDFAIQQSTTQTGNTYADRLYIDASGNVGIGTSSPGAKLDVSGNIRLSAATPNIEFNNGGGMVYAPAGNTLAFATGGGPGAPIERMRITAAGFVGVGTGSPGAQFENMGQTRLGANLTPVAPSSTDILSTANSAFGGNGGNYLTIGLYPGAQGFAQWIQSSFSNPTTAVYNLVLQPLGGNVGIGTASPSAKLDVNGDFKAGNTVNIGLADTSPTIVNVGTGATGDKFAVLDFIGDTTYTDYGLRIGRLNNGANGTSEVQHRGTGALNLNCQDAGVITFTTSATERMRISASGSVNIGGTGADATFMVSTGLGGYDRLTQMSPSAASKNAFNIMAAKDASSTDLWWSWGVRNDNVWVMQEGVNYSLNGGLAFYYDSGGQAYKSGGGSWAATSDSRVKTNIAPISDAASRIMALKPSSFDYRVPEAHKGRVADRGFIAQDFEEIYPHSISESAMVADAEKALITEDDKIKAISLNNDFFADLVALVQEQHTKITTLEARLALLEGN